MHVLTHFIKLLMIASPLDSKAITLEKAILADPLSFIVVANNLQSFIENFSIK